MKIMGPPWAGEEGMGRRGFLKSIKKKKGSQINWSRLSPAREMQTAREHTASAPGQNPASHAIS